MFHYTKNRSSAAEGNILLKEGERRRDDVKGIFPQDIFI
jgi:hypothetical protein